MGLLVAERLPHHLCPHQRVRPRGHSDLMSLRSMGTAMDYDTSGTFQWELWSAGQVLPRTACANTYLSRVKSACSCVLDVVGL